MKAGAPAVETRSVYDALESDYARLNPESGARWADPIQLLQLVGLVSRWIDTEDSQFMDTALIYCQRQMLPIFPSLLEFVTQSVKKRWELKSPKKVKNESAKNSAFRIMANLVARDYPIEQASEVAAVWTVDHGGRLTTAGTLEREFSKTGWKQTAQDIREHIALWSSGDVEQQWHQMVQECRDLTDEEKGYRR